MNVFQAIGDSLLATIRDVVPIATVILLFQLLVLRKPIPHARRMCIGFACVVLGLSLLLVGLELALFPLGKSMARQLSSPEFLLSAENGMPGEGNLGFARDGDVENEERIQDRIAALPWWAFGWTYAFAFCIGFSTAIAEPGLIAVATKANSVSGGAIGVWRLRLAVALGVALGVTLGTLRIVAGWPLPYVIIAVCAVAVLQTYFSPHKIVPLAYDSGVAATTVVTVPVVAALGLGLADNLPGRDPLIDGFGMIVLAVLFPAIVVMGYAQLTQWREKGERGT
jgi:hypothetical protein